MKSAVVFVLCVAFACAAPKPNIIMLFVDDLGAGDLGFTGHPTTHTPNLDALAHGGMTLTTWYSGAPLCSASRAALMTGRVAERVGVPPVFGPTGNVGMRTNETTVAQVALAAGYKTAAVGKWHLGQMPEFMPGARGFQHYLGIPYSDDMGKARATPCTGSGPAALVSKQLPIEDYGYTDAIADMEKFGDPAGTYLPLVHQEGDGTTASLDVLEQPLDFSTLAEKYNKFATDFITNNTDNPFFLYMPFSHVHTTANNQPAGQYAGCQFQNSTKRGPFGDALAEVDWIVGNVVATLAEMKLTEDTLILMTGDNGPWLVHGLSAGSEGLFTGRTAGYWNTGKGCTWEGGVREAGFAYWPGQIAAGSRSLELVSSLDLLPTVANLTGQALPTNRTYDGRNMLPVLMGGPSLHEVFFMYNERCVDGGDGWQGPCAARMGSYKAHFVTQPGIGDCIGNCTEIVYGLDPPLIFNVDMDPSEAYPLTAYKDMPTDPILSNIVGQFTEAYTAEMASFVPVSSQTGTGGTPGQYGICCDRSKNCDCDGPPSSA